MQSKRNIPRAWEVDWAIPAAEGGTRWESYEWLLNTAEELGISEVSIAAATYDALGRLDLAIGRTEANCLRVQPHRYCVDGITVHGISRHGFWHVHGPVLVAWADNQDLAEMEGRRPPAIAAVAQWPDDIATWRSVHHPERVGQVRADQEAEFDTTVVTELDRQTTQAIGSAAAIVNENHSALSTYERESIVGALVALRTANIRVDAEALRAYLMSSGWNGKLIGQALKLAERIEDGETPRHRPFRLGPA